MSVLHIGLVQAAGNRLDVGANMAEGESWCRRAKAAGADVALFPEMWSTGYDLTTPRWQDLAQPADGPFVAHFQALAAELDMAVAISFLEAWDGPPRNSVALIERHGRLVLVYAKVHTCDFDLEAALTPRDGFPVADLDTSAGVVKAGAMICFDREFPEPARLLMLEGAELILVPNAWNCREDWRTAALATRAYENAVVVAMANYPAPYLDGRSAAFSPVVCDPEGRLLNPLLVQAGRQPGIYVASVDLQELRAFRAAEGQGDAYRKPDGYGPLAWTGPPKPPFVRSDSRRSMR
jgi:N-carbamoylputrescine amidase